MLLGGYVGCLGVKERKRSVVLGKRLLGALRGEEDAREVGTCVRVRARFELKYIFQHLWFLGFFKRRDFSDR